MTRSIWSGASCRIVLGSRSPRRRDLMASVFGVDSLIILPPSTPNEPGFEGMTQDEQINEQLRQIVRMKHDDVLRQLAKSEELLVPDSQRPICVVSADTTVVVGRPAARSVLGQPEMADWRSQVRYWFQEYLAGKTHEVRTAARISCGDAVRDLICCTRVSFQELSSDQIEWYIQTEESVGKAGGYAIQGHAAAFVNRVEGSLTNVIGLPLTEVAEAIQLLVADTLS